jgi:hypothetical protein
MTEIGLAEYFSMAEAVGIIATLFVILYFSRKQIQGFSIDLETKILNDLDDKFVGLTKMVMEHPELMKVVSKQTNPNPEIAFSFHILYTFAHAYHMRQRSVISDNEWTGWLRWIKSAFQQGTISDIWKSDVELEKWFDPAFQEFINNEIVPTFKST